MLLEPNAIRSERLRNQMPLDRKDLEPNVIRFQRLRNQTLSDLNDLGINFY